MTRAALIFLATFGVMAGNAAAANLPADTTAILGGNAALTAPFAAPISDSFSGEQSMSRNGRFIAFASLSDGLANDDNDGVMNIYVKDMGSGAVTLASRRTGPAGAPATQDCFNPAISDDGNRVAFACFGSLDPADGNDKSDVYVRDLRTNETILVSRKSNGGPVGDTDSGNPSLSADGNEVAFAAGSGNLSDAQVPAVYVGDLAAHTTTLVSRPNGVTDLPNGGSRNPSISDDGNKVAFESDASNMVGDDNNGATDVFVRTISTNTTILASRKDAANGQVGNGASTEPALSGDGNVVAFTSESTIFDFDHDNTPDPDVYARFMSTGATNLIDIDQAPGNRANLGADHPAIDTTGRVIAYQSSATNLDPAVTVPTPEIYVALNGVRTQLVSRASGAAGAVADDADVPSVSGDGTQVLFQGRPSLSGDAIPGITSVQVRTLAANSTVAASRPFSQPFGNQGGFSESASPSADGRFVAFVTNSPALGVPATAETEIVVRDTATGATVLASRADGPNGAPLTGDLLDPSVSADGRRVAFELRPPGGAPEQVWLRDLTTGRTLLVSRADGRDGAAANGFAVAPQIGADGNRVMFISGASNLGDGDTDTRRDVHVRDLAAGRTILVDRANGVDGAKSNNDVELASFSADGSHVAFATAATNLGDGDTDGIEDVHVRDLAKGTTKLASVSSNNEKGNQNSTDPAISGDGSRVSFGSAASNLSSQPLPGEEVWVHDFSSGKTILASRADGANGAPGVGDSFNTFMSANGQVVAFESEATNFFSGTRGDFETYRRDLSANTTRLVSRGAGANGAAVPGFGGTPEGITADGACVTFSATGLLLGPAPGAADNVQSYMRTFKANCGRPGTSGLGSGLDKTSPVLRSVSLSRTRFRVAKGRSAIASAVRRGTLLRLMTSEAGRLTVRIDRARAGRKVRKGRATVCRVTHKHLKHGRCTAYTKAATITGAVKAGNVTVKLTGRIGRRRMAAASYRLTVTLRDASGNVSKPASLRFTIIPG